MAMDGVERTETEFYWVYDREKPAGANWRFGNLEFVRTEGAPGGVTHHVFIYNDRVKYEDRTEEDAFWAVGTLHVKQRKVIEFPWEETDADEWADRTGMFKDYR